MNKNQLLDDLCDYSLKIFKQYFEEKKEKLSDNMVSQFENFAHIAELKSKLRQEIKDKIENIYYIFTINNEDELDL
jgi:Mg/Co/Ni transporter MgtE